MKRVTVRLKERSYDILIGALLLKRCGAILKSLDMGDAAVVITNARLLKLYGKRLASSLKAGKISCRFELVPDSERAKSTAVAGALINRIGSYDKRKRVFIIALGGGVVGDLAGFVASVYKRGIPYAQVPTTLLAQVDSSIGGKVALDLAVAKNLIGAFYQPRVVICDTSLIETLPVRQLRNGLAECIKYGVIKDRALFKFIERSYRAVLGKDSRALEYIVGRCARIKAEVVSRDEYDKKGARAILNFGHTIGHAIESAAGYSQKYNHGEAIAIGMIAASRIARILGMMSEEDAGKIEALIADVGLPTRARGVRFDKVYESHLHDKKFIRKKNRFVLPVKIGRVRIVEGIPETFIKDVLREIL